MYRINSEKHWTYRHVKVWAAGKRL